MNNQAKRKAIATAINKYNTENNEIFDASVFIISCTECRPAIVISCDRNSAIVTFCRKVIANLQKYRGNYNMVGVAVSDEGNTIWLKSQYGSNQVYVKSYRDANSITDSDLEMASSLFIEALI